MNNSLVSGVLIVNKEAGMTSNTMIQKIKRLLNVKKIGHAGTLDPDATGVMLVLINEATKISDYLLNDSKVYEAEVIIGEARDTEDASGNITEIKQVEQLDHIDEILNSLIGKSMQTPPMYSAIKQNGKKLYELAHKGIEVERVARSIEIYSLERISKIFYHKNTANFMIRAHVSKGTYIRTLAVQIGEKLGYPSHMGKLIRISSGIFDINSSYKLTDIEEANYKLISMLDSLKNYQQVEVNDELKKQVLNGVSIEQKLINANNNIIVLYNNSELLGIYEKSEGIYKAKRVWN